MRGLPPEIKVGLGNGPFGALFDDPRPGAVARLLSDSNRAPGPYFDPVYYKAQNPDWSTAAHPVLHYLLCHIAGDERAAHPLFDAAYYAAQNPDLAEANAATLLHFAAHGDAEDRSPSTRFDAHFYRQSYLPLEAQRPLRHFITQGAAAGHAPTRPKRTPGALRAHLAAQITGARPVLIMGHDARQAGAPIALLEITRALSERGWTPIILLQDGGPLTDAYRALGPVTLLCEGWDSADLEGLCPDVPLLASTCVAAEAAALAAPGRRTLLLIQEMPAFWRSAGHLPAMIEAGKAGAALLFLTDAQRCAFATDAGAAVDTAQLHVEMQRVLPQRLTCAARLKRARSLRRGGPIVIGAGYADHRKGFDLFLETAQRLHEQDPSLRFVWLGALSRWAENLAQEALSAGLPLHLPGFVADAAAWYASADVFLLASRQDPGPSVMADAGAQGIPAVAFEADLGLIDLLREHARVVPAEDTAAAAGAVRDTLAETTPATRRARRRFISRYTRFSEYADMLEMRLSGQ